MANHHHRNHHDHLSHRHVEPFDDDGGGVFELIGLAQIDVESLLTYKQLGNEWTVELTHPEKPNAKRGTMTVIVT